jgi:PDZ domain-containing protein
VARYFTPARLAAGAALLVLATAAVLFLVPSSSYYLFLPDPAHPLAPIVKVAGERHPAKDVGGFYFVDVRFRKARLYEQLFSSLRPDNTTLVRVDQVRAPGVSEREQEQQDIADMAQSQKIAAGVALQRLGYRVPGLTDGVLVSRVIKGAPAARVLRKGDRIVGASGHVVRTTADLRRILGGHSPGDVLSIAYRRDGRVLTARIKTIADPDFPGRTIIGIISGLKIKLPIKIHFATRGVGGPSAGLAFALDVTEELGRNVDHGYKVAATGALEPDGTIDEIGGVQQKTIGARDAGVDVFVVPAGNNARVARRYAGGLRVLAVKSFPQALHALATLPEKRSGTA